MANPPASDVAIHPPRSTVDVRNGRRHDAAVFVGELLLIAAAAIVGAALNAHHVPIHASAAPLIATWVPHIGPGTAIAITLAALVLWRGVDLAATLPWRRLLGLSYVVAVMWTLGLALVDGWSRGVAGRLATTDEYLHDVPRVHGVGALLATFSDHILNTRPGFWTTHVAGHPPGAILVFVGLNRIGLGGGGPAGIVCILIGAVAIPSVAVTVRALGRESTARSALPFLVLFPGAVWVGASADGLFMGIAAAGIAGVAVNGWWRNLIGGLLLGFSLYVSYGLVLLGLLALVPLVRRPAKLLPAGLGVVAVVAAFTAGGFWWLTGYRLVTMRYYAGYGGIRPYAYWVWANLACLLICAGPAIGPALRRTISQPRGMLMPIAATAALIAADLSGLSKGETERIWLPYAIWLLPATALLPTRGRRGWLAAQAATALIVNHLFLTHW